VDIRVFSLVERPAISRNREKEPLLFRIPHRLDDEVEGLVRQLEVPPVGEAELMGCRQAPEHPDLLDEELFRSVDHVSAPIQARQEPAVLHIPRRARPEGQHVVLQI